jgi:hypothetical protein
MLTKVTLLPTGIVTSCGANPVDVIVTAGAPDGGTVVGGTVVGGAGPGVGGVGATGVSGAEPDPPQATSQRLASRTIRRANTSLRFWRTVSVSRPPRRGYSGDSR